MKQGKKEKHDSKKEKGFVSQNEHDDLKDMLQRLNAEFQNYRKRTEEEKSRFVKLSNEALIKNIIPVIDNFELALKHNKEKSEFTQGMEMIYAQLLEVLEQEGVQRIPAVGKFNPELHEVIMVEESDGENGLILQELQRGYTLNDRILRSSKVKISKKKNLEVNKNE